MQNEGNKVVSPIKLYVDDSMHNIPASIYMKQYDTNSRSIKVDLQDADGQISAGLYQRLNITKPDGSQEYVSGTTNDDGTINFDIPSSVLSDSGILVCDVTAIYSENLFNQSDATSGHYVKASDGTTAEADTLSVSDYIPVTAESTYTVFGNSALDDNCCAFYNSGKTYISGVTTASANSMPVTAPSNAAYVRFTIATERVNNTFVVAGTEIQRVTSSSFRIVVGKSNYDAEAIEGSEEYSEVTEALAQMSENLSEAEDIRDGINSLIEEYEGEEVTKADGLYFKNGILSLKSGNNIIPNSSVTIFANYLEGIKSGTNITVDDAAEMPLLEFSTSMQARQDSSFRGYGHPWAGGTWKNLFDYSSSQILDRSFNWNGGTTATIAASNNKSITIFPCSGGKTYTIQRQGNGDVGNQFVAGYTSSTSISVGTTVSGIQHSTVSGTGVTSVKITTPSAARLLVIGLGPSSTVNDIKKTVQVEIGAQMSEYTPYANVCPITGITSVSFLAYPIEYDISLGRAVYAGTFDAITGTLSISGELFTLGPNASWTYDGTTDSAFVDIPNKSITTDTTLYKTNIFDVCQNTNEVPDGRVALVTAFADGKLHFCGLSNIGITSLAQWENLLNRNQLTVLCPLSMAETTQIGGIDIGASSGTNSFSSSTGYVKVRYYSKPEQPTQNGIYVLVCHVSNGNRSYRWE